MTQKQLASATGFSRPAISRMEAGDSNPELGTLERLANALRIAESLLIARSGRTK